MNGPIAQQHVARERESGLELARIRAEQIMVLVKERVQRPKVAVSLNVEVYSVIGKNGVNGLG